MISAFECINCKCPDNWPCLGNKIEMSLFVKVVMFKAECLCEKLAIIFLLLV